VRLGILTMAVAVLLGIVVTNGSSVEVILVIEQFGLYFFL
jgi:hypothetical protein